jgi:hypothetical protein
MVGSAHCWLRKMGGRLPLGVLAAAFIAVWAVAAEAKKPSGEDGKDTSRSISDRGRAADSRSRDPGSHVAPARVASPSRQVAPPPVAQRSLPAPAVKRLDVPRASAPEIRRADPPRTFAADARRSSPPAASAGAERALPVLRSGTVGSAPAARTSTTPSFSSGNGRPITSDARTRLGDQPSGSSFPLSNREARTDSSKAPRLGNSGAKANSAPPASFSKSATAAHLPTTPVPTSAPGSNRQGISDVRKRLGDSRRDGPATSLGATAGRPVPRAGAGANPGQGARTAGGAATVKSRAGLREMADQRFPERLKSGQLDRLTKGATAQDLKLGDQYRLAQQGDAARRLQLQKNVKNVVNVNKAAHATNITNVSGVRSARGYHHEDHYHGLISPHYARSSFEFRYHGPHFFAGVCWYPSWNPWVDWSWHYQCRSIWDPRPIWCRPIIYEPCPVWVYYPVPVWTPLPEAPSGTWVDVQRPVLPANDGDLQLLAVRFVDPGHPEERLGPRYRIWFRNNSAAPITQAFNVVAIASADGQLAPGLPQAGARVTAIEAGDTQSVDVRLPFDVYSMGRDPQGRAAPYSTVHVLVDANREVPETARDNNGATLAVTDVLPVDPAAFELEPNTAAPGGEILLAGEGFGPEPGRVLVQVGGQELDGEILGWYDLGVRVRLPNVALAGPTAADVIVVRGDSAAANPLRVTMSPAGAKATAPGIPLLK